MNDASQVQGVGIGWGGGLLRKEERPENPFQANILS